MSLDNMTIAEFKEMRALLGGEAQKKYPVEIGKSYLFRTVTHIDVGRVTAVTGSFATIENASWIADTGRYHNSLRDGTFSEVEPYPTVAFVNLEALVDFAPWSHDLPNEQK